MERDPSVRVVVLTGTGDVFSAGADLKMVAAGDSSGFITKRGGFGGIVTRDFPKPIIAAVNGTAVAGGFEIALACDLIVAADSAWFGLFEVKRGLFAGGGGLIRLPRRVPLALAMELAIVGSTIDAARAYSVGLVNRVVPTADVVDTAVGLAEEIAANSPLAVRKTRQMVREAGDLTEEEGWKRSAELSRAGVCVTRFGRGRSRVRREARPGLEDHLTRGITPRRRPNLKPCETKARWTNRRSSASGGCRSS